MFDREGPWHYLQEYPGLENDLGTVKSQLKGKPVVQDISNVQNGIQTARLDDLAFEEIVVKEQDSEAPMWLML